MTPKEKVALARNKLLIAFNEYTIAEVDASETPSESTTKILFTMHVLISTVFNALKRLSAICNKKKGGAK